MTKKTKWQEFLEKKAADQKDRGVNPADLLNPETKMVNDEEAQARLSICFECPKLTKITKQCRECGCFMPLKTKLLYATCPLEKW